MCDMKRIQETIGIKNLQAANHKRLKDQMH